ncbi:hypothetical protein UR09_05760 [Candidatus Nitromaritima sp. SCGC AAA799-A02]|nr:hypothetical protein UR09_05760 [Candidatus Nitromaritima sp. SCGC AAA799-A02]
MIQRVGSGCQKYDNRPISPNLCENNYYKENAGKSKYIMTLGFTNLIPGSCVFWTGIKFAKTRFSS